MRSYVSVSFWKDPSVVKLIMSWNKKTSKWQLVWWWNYSVYFKDSCAQDSMFVQMFVQMLKIIYDMQHCQKTRSDSNCVNFRWWWLSARLFFWSHTAPKDFQFAFLFLVKFLCCLKERSKSRAAAVSLKRGCWASVSLWTVPLVPPL